MFSRWNRWGRSVRLVLILLQRRRQRLLPIRQWTQADAIFHGFEGEA
ncbi:hypothetical protein I4I65_19215, partial [Xanthomonas campestris pv. campestris]|nr:hypothetical protein [Xanthomonas campestris pv. campestris]